jgi:hypothetical protein
MTPPRGVVLLRVGCVLGWATGPLLAMGGIFLLGLSRLAPPHQDRFLEQLMEPTFYVASWMLYAREPIRYLWCNLGLLGGGLLVFASLEMLLLVQAWRLQPWAVALQVVLSGGWLLTGVGLPAGVLLAVGGSLAVRTHLDAPRARAGKRVRLPAKVSPRTPPA